MLKGRRKIPILERLLALLLATFFAMSVGACGGEQESSSSTSQSTASTSSSEDNAQSSAAESSGNSQDSSSDEDSSSDKQEDSSDEDSSSDKQDSSSDEDSSSGEEEGPEQEEQIRQNLYKALSDGLQKPFCLTGDVNGESAETDKTDTLSLKDISASARLSDDGSVDIYGDGDISLNVAGIPFAKSGEFVLHVDGSENAQHEAWFYDGAFEKFRVDENVNFYVIKNFSSSLTAFAKGLTDARDMLGGREIDLFPVFQLLSDNEIEFTVEEKQEGGYSLHLVDGEYGAKVNELLASLSDNADNTVSEFLKEKGLDVLALYNAITALLSGKITVGDGLTMVTNYLQKEGIALSAEDVFALILGHGTLEGYKNQILDDVVAERFDGKSYQELVKETRDKIKAVLEKTVSALMQEYSLPEQLLSADFTKLALELSAEFDGECILQGVALNLQVEMNYGEKACKLTAALCLEEFGREFSLPQESEYFIEPNFAFTQKTGDFMKDEPLVYTFDKGSASCVALPQSVALSYSGNFTNGTTKANIFNRTFTLSSEQIENILTAGEDTLTFLVGEMKKAIAEDVRAYMIENDGANAEFYRAQTAEFFLQNFTYSGPRGVTLGVSFAYGEQVLVRQVTFDLRK